MRYSVRISVSVWSVQAKIKNGERKEKKIKVVYNSVNAEILMEIVLVHELSRG